MRKPLYEGFRHNESPFRGSRIWFRILGLSLALLGTSWGLLVLGFLVFP